jgi:hypothetical protein
MRFNLPTNVVVSCQPIASAVGDMSGIASCLVPEHKSLFVLLAYRIIAAHALETGKHKI